MNPLFEGMKAKLFVVAIVALLLFLNNATFFGESFRDKTQSKKFLTAGDTIDQQQTDGNEKQKIYGNIFVAQSFKPAEEEITRIQLKVGKAEDRKNILQLERIFQKNPLVILLKYIEFFTRKPEYLIVAIKNSLSGENLALSNISFNDVEKSGGWVEVKFENISVSNETYYIVCYTEGGNENNCFIWLYSNENPYGNGSSFISNNGGSTWNEEAERDFCFITYGKDREGDGITNYWAVIVGIEEYKNISSSKYSSNDAVDFKETLIANGWKEGHIHMLINELATKTDIINELLWMDKMEDEDDVVLFMFSGWGERDAIITYENDTISDEEINEIVNKMGSLKIVVIIDCWYSGSFIDTLSSYGRIIMTSCREYEKSWRYDLLRNSVFIYYLSKGLNGDADEIANGGNDDNVVTAEEAFYYSSYLTSIFEKPQHPQIYDGYDGELPISFLK
ncbi:MAG TPA: caspase family protein [Thermoplasmatales archaeon]|nr:caspase family protein [Thermoplasmatales archaeon]